MYLSYADQAGLVCDHNVISSFLSFEFETQVTQKENQSLCCESPTGLQGLLIILFQTLLIIDPPVSLICHPLGLIFFLLIPITLLSPDPLLGSSYITPQFVSKRKCFFCCCYFV